MFSIAKKAASRLRFTNLFNRAIGLTTNATTTESPTAAAAEHPFASSDSARHHHRDHHHHHSARGMRSRRRRDPSVNNIHDATGVDAEPVQPNSRLLTNLRDRYRGATAVRTRVRKHNELRKERSLQRALRMENNATAAAAAAGATSGSASSGCSRSLRREFHILAGNVHHAMVTAEGPKTRDDVIFERGLAELVGDFVAARKVVDKEFAKEVAITFDQIDAEDFMVQLEEERARVESAMAVKRAEENAEREEKERVRRERELEEEREREKALEEARLINQSRIREAEVRRAEARRQKQAKLAAEERVRQLREEHEMRLQEERRLRDQERQARVEAERIARLERERVSRLEEEAQLAREREEQRLRDEEQTRAWMEAELLRAAEAENLARQEDECARRRLDEYFQSVLDAGVLEAANQRFQAQEDRLRAQFEAEAMAQAQAQWSYVQPEHYYWQEQDTPMRDLSDIDISMASIPADEHPLPKSNAEWFSLYETRWQELRGPNNSTDELAFPSFPWPAFRLVRTLDELADEDIKSFFASKYPGALDKSWKVELTRWHPDKIERLRNRIRPDGVEAVRMGFLKCTMVMNAFQEDKEAGRT